MASITGVSCFDGDDATEPHVTRQVQLDSYEDAGVLVALDLVNVLMVTRAYGRPVTPAEPLSALSQILAFDPPSLAMLGPGDAPGFVALARQLGDVFADISGGDVDAAATRLNALLAVHPAHPHLAKEDGVWRLHHHPGDVALVPMYTSICAEALARLVGGGHADRLGTCDGTDCDRVFVDVSKNGSRRFCSITCQNRMKAAAFRQRHAARDAHA
jgi:hypothetical protein